MDVWIVEHKRLFTGMRIEGFQIKLSIFLKKDEALKHAWEIAKKHGVTDYNDEGKYVAESDGGYDDWPDYQITTTKKIFNTEGSIALEYATQD